MAGKHPEAQARYDRKAGITKSRDLAPDDGTLRALWLAAATDVEQVILVLCAGYGLRCDEASHFNRNWWDAGRAAITIPGTCYCDRCPGPFATRPRSKDGGDGIKRPTVWVRNRWTPKTPDAARTIEVGGSPTALLTIRRFLESNDGVYLDRRTVYRLVDGLYRRSGAERPTAIGKGRSMLVHGLRAAALTRIAQGIRHDEGGLAKLQKIAGWADISTGTHYLDVRRSRSQGDLWLPAEASSL